MKKFAMKGILLLCVLAFFLSLQNVFGLSSLARSQDRDTSFKTAADFTLDTIKGNTVSLRKYRGKGVIIFFFTTWCPHCRDMFSYFSKNKGRFEKENIELLLMDVGESKAKIDSFLKRQRASSFDVLLDTDMEAAGAYGVIGVPTFILVSEEGQLRYRGNRLPANYLELLK